MINKIGMLLVVCCLLLANSAKAKASLALKNCIDLNQLKVVVITEDQSTDDWLKQENSQYDKLPILGPETPDKRKRELFLRLQDSLNALTQPPIVIAWDYFFPKSNVLNQLEESPASKDFGKSLNRSRLPVVIASWTGGGQLDSRIHMGGAQRFTGHISLFRDKEGVRFSPVSKMDQRLREYLTQDTFVVATIAAIINGKCQVPRKASLRAARHLACQSADEKPAEEIATIKESGEPMAISGIKLTELPLQTVSMKSVILNETAAIESLKDAVVIIGNATTDMGGIFKDDKIESKPLVYVHAWTIVGILSHMSIIGPFEKKKINSKLICSR